MWLDFLFLLFVGNFFLTYPVLHIFISHANGQKDLYLPSPAPYFDTLQVFLI